MRSCLSTAWKRWLRHVCLEMTLTFRTTIQDPLAYRPIWTYRHPCPASAWEASSRRQTRTRPTWRWPAPTETGSVTDRPVTWTPNTRAPAASREPTRRHPRSHRPTPSSDRRTDAPLGDTCRKLLFDVCMSRTIRLHLNLTWLFEAKAWLRVLRCDRGLARNAVLEKLSPEASLTHWLQQVTGDEDMGRIVDEGVCGRSYRYPYFVVSC